DSRGSGVRGAAPAGCISAPLPQELVPVAAQVAPSPLHSTEVLRLAKAGIGDDVILELLQTRGVVARPGPAGVDRLRREGVSPPVIAGILATPAADRPVPPPARYVYRTLFIPLWPCYSGGHGRIGLHGAIYSRTSEVGKLDEPAEDPEYVDPHPKAIDP